MYFHFPFSVVGAPVYFLSDIAHTEYLTKQYSTSDLFPLKSFSSSGIALQCCPYRCMEMKGNFRYVFICTQRQYPKVSDTRTGNYYIPRITELEDDPLVLQHPHPKKKKIKKLLNWSWGWPLLKSKL